VGFGQFLFIISGPILLLFATNLMLPDSARASDGNYRAHYYGIASRFFGLLAGLMAWMLGVDLLFGGGMSTITWLNVFEGGLLVIVALSTRPPVHHAVTLLTAVIMVLGPVLQGLDVV
jgi:hypothetical protein